MVGITSITTLFLLSSPLFAHALETLTLKGLSSLGETAALHIRPVGTADDGPTTYLLVTTQPKSTATKENTVVTIQPSAITATLVADQSGYTLAAAPSPGIIVTQECKDDASDAGKVVCVDKVRLEQPGLTTEVFSTSTGSAIPVATVVAGGFQVAGAVGNNENGPLSALTLSKFMAVPSVLGIFSVLWLL